MIQTHNDFRGLRPVAKKYSRRCRSGADPFVVLLNADALGQPRSKKMHSTDIATLLTTPTPTSKVAAARAFSRHAPTVARILLGLVFFGFGLDGFLNFVPKPDPSTMPDSAVAFSSALVGTGYMIPLLKGTEVLAGALLLTNRFLPLALALLAPVIVNIVLFHAFLSPSGLGFALVLLTLHLALAGKHRHAYRPMLGARS